ncbi:MAG: AAA family ATPase [Tannerellaceae bacterium]|jgi:replicative DNA helicase|nr:AAA family ATPase [Tannerellaceae bacterium]
MEKKDIPAYVSVVFDEEVERNVLGSLMSYRKAFDEINEFLSGECFSTDFHRDVFEAIHSLVDKGDPVDTLIVNAEMQRLGKWKNTVPYNLTALLNCSSPNYYRNAMLLNDFRSRNRAYLIGQKMVKFSKDMTFDIYDSVEEAGKELSEVFTIPSNAILDTKDLALSLYNDHIKKNLSGERQLTGSPTGFSQFDEKTGGFQKGNLIIIAAETSQGKTSLATSMIMSAAKCGHPIAFYSMEMTAVELFARMTACETGISSNKYLYGQLNAEELKIFDTSLRKLTEMPVYFDDKSTSSIDVIISSIRVMVAKKGVKGAVIDYIQILSVNMKGSNVEQQMGEVARRLKNLAKDLGIWIIALSQLRRDDNSHVPTLGRLRNSGQIGEAADIIVLLYRPEVYNLNYPAGFKDVSTNGTAMIDIAKGRNVGLIKFIVGFDSTTTRFYELGDVKYIPQADDRNPF